MGVICSTLLITICLIICGILSCFMPSQKNTNWLKTQEFFNIFPISYYFMSILFSVTLRWYIFILYFPDYFLFWCFKPYFSVDSSSFLEMHYIWSLEFVPFFSLLNRSHKYSLILSSWFSCGFLFESILVLTCRV